MLTDKDYVEHSGMACPNCEKEGQVEGRQIEVGSDGAYQSCSCNACGADWVDCYKLTGFDCLTVDGEFV